MLIPISIVIPYRKINQDIEVWVQVRKSSDDLNGLLEFPGGKIEKGEDPVTAGVREVYEEAGVKLDANKLIKFKNYTTEIGEQTIFLMVYLYPCEEEAFATEGFKPLPELQEDGAQIPPANKQILFDIETFFV